MYCKASVRHHPANNIKLSLGLEMKLTLYLTLLEFYDSEYTSLLVLTEKIPVMLQLTGDPC